ncbi:MAG: cupin domain-containing protein [Arenicellales bacterium]
MHRSTMAVSFLLTAVLTASNTGNTVLASGDQQEYKCPGSIKDLLLKEPLHGVQDEQVTVSRVTFPPGWKGAQHYHTGPVYVYVLSGPFVVREKGKKPRTIKAGSLYREPIGNPMEAHNASATRATRALIVQIGRRGQPLMNKTRF